MYTGTVCFGACLGTVPVHSAELVTSTFALLVRRLAAVGAGVVAKQAGAWKSLLIQQGGSETLRLDSFARRVQFETRIIMMVILSAWKQNLLGCVEWVNRRICESERTHVSETPAVFSALKGTSLCVFFFNSARSSVLLCCSSYPWILRCHCELATAQPETDCSPAAHRSDFTGVDSISWDLL